MGEDCSEEGRLGKVRGPESCSGGGLRVKRWHGEQEVVGWGWGWGRKMLVIPSVLIAGLDGQAERT